MATYGQSSRNRPALYKPTDFGSQQKRLSSVSASSSSELKKDEEKVTFKIQQRPAPSDEKPPTMEINKSVKILKESPTAEKSNGTKKVEENPGVIGSRDLDKIKQLKEFMAKLGDNEPALAKAGESEPPAKAKSLLAMAPPKDSTPAIGKCPPSQTKPQPQALMKIPTTAVKPPVMSLGKLPVMPSGKLPSTLGKGLGMQSKMGCVTGKSPAVSSGGKPTASSGKLFKENKDPEIMKEEKSAKDKALRDGKDGKNKGGGRPNSNRNQKNVSKPPPSRNKPNEKAVGKQNKNNESNQNIKPAGKAVHSPHNGGNNGGTRPKIITSKAPMNNARLSNDAHKNQNRPYDRSAQNQSSVNSYYSQANKISGYSQTNTSQATKISGFPNNEPPPWLSLPYGMNGLHLNKQSILGQPQGARIEQPQGARIEQAQGARIGPAQGARLDFSQKNTPGTQEKNTDPLKNEAFPSKSNPAANLASAQKKVVTVAATKDKSEQKKSLDFVKSFFDNDPEVQYNRKLHAETRSTIKPPAVTATPSLTELAPKEEAPTSSRLQQHVTNHISNHGSSHISNHGNSQLSSHVNSRVNSHVNSQINSQISSQINSHVNSLVSNHGNSQSFVHSSSHMPGSHLAGSHLAGSHLAGTHLAGTHVAGTHLAGTHVAGTHIPGSIATTYSSVYHSNLSNMAHNSALHQSAPHFQGSSAGTAVHMGASPNQLHATISHPSSLQHGQQTYDLYSNQMNPLLSSSYHGAVNNYPASAMSHSSGGSVNPGFPSYSGYFTDGSHMSHVHHIQQQIDPTAVTDILQNQACSKNWQEKSLTKSGHIDSNQARSLIDQLIDGTYECMVCCESVKWNNQVWSCSNCYHVFHLTCIRKWARSETAAVKDESGWRCPGCQNVSTRPPNKYYCFCGKVRDPDWNPRDGITPHSCGEVCIKKRTNPSCEHSCNELCHPGPCPTCPVMVAKHCPCGKTITKARCGQANQFKCESICSKYLNCGKHKCEMKCHKGACTPCEMKHSEECFCGRERHYVVCGTGDIIPDEVPGPKEKCQKKYTCNQPCNNKLACGNHDCEDLCHPGDCKSCALLPENVTFCPCGKVRVSMLLAEGEARTPTLLEGEVRTSCLDAIPTCESFCGKKLSCGPKGSSHLCMMKCHTGKCQPCQKVTTVQCRCGTTKKEIACKDLNPSEDILCERKCNKKRKCGRHKCNLKCCTERDHTCNIICGKKLSCGMHKCEEVCHTGFCPPCWRAGFDELSCNCGATVLYPPIACGMKPPECDQPCTRKHPCGHPPTHTCHSDEACPPCTLLINKQCMGGHEIWKNVPCHLSDVSCGRNCGKILPCGFHKCIKTCHRGACFDEGETCAQPCPVKRKDCTHPCAARCHAGMMDCLTTPCKAEVTIRCRCGRKTANAFCLAGSVTSAYESFNSEILTSQLRNLQSGQSIDLASLTSADRKPKFLDCDEECSRLERNKRLAEALGIENPEGGHFQATNFSSFLKQEAKSHFPFVKMIEEVLENLVLNVKKSTQSQIQHSLPPMNATQRKIVHEMADVYGCKTFSLDPEPKRNTVVVASKESYNPSIKLSTLTEREIMAPTAPQPVMLCKEGFMVLGPTVKPVLKKSHAGMVAPKVDYFDDNYKE